MKHTPNTSFATRINQEEAVELLREVYSIERPSYDARALDRMKEVGVNTNEVEAALESSNVTSYEIPPSKQELRLEVLGVHGDMREFVAVVYISCGHRLFIVDMREYKPVS